MSSEQALQWLVDHEQIRQLAYRYAVAVDARDTATIGELFDPEAWARSGVHGAAQIAERYDEMLKGSPVSILAVSNHLIDLDDATHGRGVVYCRAEIADGDEWLVQAIVYRDRYVKGDGVWRFLEREHLLFYGADLLQRPIGLPPAGKPEHYRGKGSMPEIWPTYQQFQARMGPADPPR